MKRSPLFVRWLGILAALATLVAAWLVASPASADAQRASEASLALAVSPLGADGETRTAALGFTQGDIAVGSLETSLIYDADAISVLSCVVSEVGACHDVGDGVVKMVVFNLTAIQTNEQLLTVDFVALNGAAETTLEVEVHVVGDLQATELETIVVEPLTIATSMSERGSLTGDVANAESGLYNLEVCAIAVATEATTCTLTSGLGTWRIDDLPAGEYRISIVDPAGVYEGATFTAAVADAEVTTGLSTELALATADEATTDDTTSDDDAATGDATTDGDSADDGTSTQVVQADTPTIVSADSSGDVAPAPITAVEVSYGASVTGSVQDIATASPLWPVQVCAVQPLVLHQSCATTNEAGEFTIDGLSAGNYRLTAVDGLGLYESADSTLVGLQTDTSTLDGVVIQLRAS